MSKENDRQGILIRWALAHENRIMTKEANALLERHYYHNHTHYVQEILHRMVKAGKIKRLKRGLYELCPFFNRIGKDRDINPNQITMF